MHQDFVTHLGQRYGLPTSLRITEYCDEPELTVSVSSQGAALRLWQQLPRLSRAAERLDCLWLRIDLEGMAEPYRRCPLEWALFFRSEATDHPKPEQPSRKSERG